MSRLVVTIVLTVGVSWAARPLAAQIPDSTRLGIDAVFARWDRTNTPGCAVGIAQGGQVVYTRGYGMADLQHGLAITPRSIFHVASISKQFAAIAVALLAEEGKLSLDDPVRKHVAEVPEYGEPVTVRQLIHHTSGLRDQWQLLGYAGWRYPDDLITERDVLGIVGRQRGLNFRPGDEWVYSNTGYTLLAVIVKRVTGQSLREFMHHRFFVPLGMHDTHFHDDHTMIVAGRTSAYEPRAGGGWRISIPVFDTYGATSLFTTVGDLLTWMAFLDRPTIGSASLYRAAQTSVVLRDGTPAGYGYGMSLARYRGLQAIGHGGADAGYRAQIERFPERGLAIAVLCNVSIAGPNVLLRSVADVLLGSSVPTPVVSIDTVPRAIAAEVRQRWVGTYRDTVAQSVLRVRLAGDTLMLGDGRRLIPTSDSTARVGSSGSAFLLRRSGGVTTAIVQVPRGTRDLAYRREAPFAPDRAALGAYAGAFFSDELDVRYDVVVQDSVLVVRHRKLEDMRLVPALRDAFTGGFGTLFQFARDRSGRVGGFTITDGRIRGVRFERVR